MPRQSLLGPFTPVTGMHRNWEALSIWMFRSGMIVSTLAGRGIEKAQAGTHCPAREGRNTSLTLHLQDIACYGSGN